MDADVCMDSHCAAGFASCQIRPEPDFRLDLLPMEWASALLRACEEFAHRPRVDWASSETIALALADNIEADVTACS